MSAQQRIEDRVKRWVHAEIQSLHAYHVQPTHNLIKLDAMENPYPWPDEMRQRWLERLQRVEINRYPDTGAESLKDHIRRIMHVPDDMQLLLGNGSDELIQVIELCVAGGARTVLAPTPSFSMYEILARCIGARFVGVPLQSDFSLDLDAMGTAIATHDPAVVFLSYPNNPTGNLFQTEAIDRIIANTDGLVVVDEAYHAFAQTTYYDRLGEFDNLLVMRTLSKLGLAGLRLGFVAGPSEWIEELNKVRLPYNINILTQVSAEFALQNIDVLEQQAREIVEQREYLQQVLSGMQGLVVYPSAANFLLLKVAEIGADNLHQHLREKGVLIKNLHKPNTLLDQCVRISVGTPEENAVFLKVLSELLYAG